MGRGFPDRSGTDGLLPGVSVGRTLTGSRKSDQVKTLGPLHQRCLIPTLGPPATPPYHHPQNSDPVSFLPHPLCGTFEPGRGRETGNPSKERNA